MDGWNDVRESGELSSGTKLSLGDAENEAVKANTLLDRQWNASRPDETAEAVDVPEMFRNES